MRDPVQLPKGKPAKEAVEEGIYHRAALDLINHPSQ
jgi:hypothetical protein